MTEPRDAALSALYEIDLRGLESVEGDPLSAKSARLVNGVLEHLEEIDAVIEDASEGWTVRRMAAVDRAVLRMAVYELVYEQDTPDAVVLSEAVRLAKHYSTERSGGFVNGVLATVAREQRPGPGS